MIFTVVPPYREVEQIEAADLNEAIEIAENTYPGWFEVVQGHLDEEGRRVIEKINVSS